MSALIGHKRGGTALLRIWLRHLLFYLFDQLSQIWQGESVERGLNAPQLQTDDI